MRFRNAVHITIDNFSNVFKYLLYRFVTNIIFFSLIYVILRLSLGSIVTSPELTELKELVKEFFHSIATGNAVRLQGFHEEFQSALVSFGQLLSRSGGAIAGAIVGMILIYLLARVVDGLATFTLGTVLYDRMSSCSRTPFYSAYFRSVGKGILYELIYVPLSFVYDALSLLACWFFFYYLLTLFVASNVFSLFVSVSLALAGFLCLEALKMTLISLWIPLIIVDKKSTVAALAQSFKTKRDFGARFASYLVALYIILVVNVAFAVFTFGSALLITVPLSYLFLMSIQFVYYYHGCGKRYFISGDRIMGEGEFSKTPIPLSAEQNVTPDAAETATESRSEDEK